MSTSHGVLRARYLLSAVYDTGVMEMLPPHNARIFFVVPCIILALLSPLLSVVPQIRGHIVTSRALLPPLPTTVHAFVFIARTNDSAFCPLVDSRRIVLLTQK